MMKRLLLCMLFSAFAHVVTAQKSVSGTIVDAAGEALIGVSVTVKEAPTVGTLTDVSGKYTINVPAAGKTLVFRYTGYTPQEVVMANQSTVDVEMEESLTSLNEVVVVGYGQQKKGDITAAISSVGVEELERSTVTSVEQALQGRAAGVNISASSGQPGAALKVQVRGATSISANSEPLYVVDGIPMTSDNNSNLFTGGYNFNSMANINPDDIASIEILKDASAAAIYGSRGANGVVIITTKRGQAGKGKIEFETYRGVQAPTKVIDMMNSREFIEMMDEAAENDGLGPGYFSTNGPGFNRIGDPNDPDLIDTDWYGAILRNDAPISNYSLNFSGGTNKSTYFVSGAYFDQDGFQRGTAFTRFSGRANMDFNVNNWLKVGTNNYISRSNAKSTVGDNSLYGVMINALAADPTMPIKEDDGTYSDPFQYYSWWAFENPVAATDLYKRNTFTNRLLSSAYAEASIGAKVKLRTSWSADYEYLKDVLFYPSTTLQAIRGGIQGQGQFSNSESLTWLNENILTYTDTFADKHNLTFLAGFTMQETMIDVADINGQNFANDNLTALALAADITSASTSGTSWGLISYLSRINYNFNSKYYLTASIRADGSSRFGSARQYGVFPSVSASWRISDENFLKNVRALTDLKLRASYGLTGNQDGINNFAARSLWTTAVNYDGQGGSVPNRMGNADLGWETTTQFDIGFDASFFNGRLGLTFDYFNKQTTDLLLATNVPGYTGFTTVVRNIGEVRNRGLEFAVNSLNVSTPSGFKWTSAFNISTIDNEIVKLEQDGQLIGTTHILKQGYPLGTFNLIRWEGINPENGNSVYTDTNGDGAINSGDASIVERDGKALTVWPDFFGGLTNTFSFKGFDVSVFLQYSKGNYLWNQSRYAQEQVGWSFDFGGFYLPYGNNTQRVVDGRWKNPGDITDIPRAGLGYEFDANGNPSNPYQNWREDADQWLEDASFIRVKTVEFAYNLPRSILNTLKMSNAKVYFRGQNLFTFTNYLGVDPEVSSVGESVTQPGIDFGGLGQARTVLVGIKLGI